MRSPKLHLVALTGAAIICTATPSTLGQTIRFVNATAPQGGNGLTWATAFRRVQDALAVAQPSDELWVAQGFYTPAGPGGSRQAVFDLRPGVAVFGGFVGNETTRAERDWRLHETILSGDLNRDESMGGGTSDNSYTVVTAMNVLANAVLDGFTVRDGSGETRSGGGVNIVSASPTVRNCLLTDNDAGIGAAVYTNGGAPRFQNCRFLRNGRVSSTPGGGLYVDGGSPVVYGCSFVGNRGSIGGAVAVGSASTVLMVNCVFVGNDAAAGGGGLFSSGGLQLVNCTVAGNRTDNAQSRGGGIRIEGASASALIRNCVLWGNTDGGTVVEVAQWSFDNPSLSADYCRIQGWSGLNNGIATSGNDPLLVDIDGPDDLRGTGDENVRLGVDSSCIDAGNNFYVPPDTFDIDSDGNTTEPLPFDADGEVRFMDIPSVPDSGVGEAPIVDIGAYEFSGRTAPCRADFNHDGIVNSQDFFDFLTDFFAGCP